MWPTVENRSCVSGRAALIRKRGEVLGTVEAPDEQAAKHVIAERFGLTQQQLTRLALREMRRVSP